MWGASWPPGVRGVCDGSCRAVSMCMYALVWWCASHLLASPFTNHLGPSITGEGEGDSGSDRLLAELDGLRARRDVELSRLQASYEARVQLIEERFALETSVVNDFERRRGELEHAMAQETRPSTSTHSMGAPAVATAGEATASAGSGKMDAEEAQPEERGETDGE